MKTCYPFFMSEYCYCCDGEESFGDCPLCENERVFTYEETYTVEDFMRDFYAETILNAEWRRLDDKEKLDKLDKELENYFSEV